MPAKNFLTYGLILLSITAFPQKNIAGLINAEKAFAKYALDSNTRDAFVKFLDTSNIALSEGKASNGYQTWLKREKREGKLIWAPEFAAIASSNDYGVTTGPYEFKLSLADTAIAKGNFTSIWHYNANGEWKNLLDHGISYTGERNWVSLVKAINIKKNKKAYKTDDAISIENNFIAGYKSAGKSVYSTFAAKDIWFNTNGNLPASGINNLSTALTMIADSIEFTPLGSGISISRDFAYVYGATNFNNKAGNYVRVWIKENGNWKLLLQVLD